MDISEKDFTEALIGAILVLAIPIAEYILCMNYY